MTTNTSGAHSPARRTSLKMCGDCTLCCKVYEIEDFEKPGKTCHNVRDEGGCGIWGLHPKACQEFKCLWLKHDDMDGRWRPDHAGFVMRVEGKGTVCIDVDHDRPDAWRREPYYSQLKQWSEVMPRNEGLVLVYAPEAMYVITPTEDLPLKAPKKGDVLETGMEDTLFGRRPYARVVPAREAKRSRDTEFHFHKRAS